MSVGRGVWTGIRETLLDREPPAADSSSGSSSETSNAELQSTLSETGQIEGAEPGVPNGLTEAQVGTLGSFGIDTATLDDEAQRRLGHALSRLETMSSCDAGDTGACEAMGPGPYSYATAENVGGDQAVVLEEEGEYKLTIWTETDPVTGQQTRHLLYEDADGTYMSGLSNEPVEVTSAPDPEQAPDPKDEEGLTSFLEGAILGDFSDNTTWSALAGQVAIGFVPYAGQVADVRDLVAAGKAVYEGKENAGWQLALSAVAVVPGFGDAVKAVGKTVLGGAVILGTAGLKHGDELVEGAEDAGERLLKDGAEESTEHADDLAAGGGKGGDQGGGGGPGKGSDGPGKPKGRPLSDEARAAFAKELGEHATDALLAKYGADALEHYGPAFFKAFKGVTDETMTHVLTPGKISKGEIRGAHDADAFLDVLVKQGNGEIVSATPMGPGVTHYEYLLYQRGVDGKVRVPPQVQARDPAPKTVVSGLASDPALWRTRFVEALDNVIRTQAVDGVSGRFDILIEGTWWQGYLRNGVLDTIYPLK